MTLQLLDEASYIFCSDFFRDDELFCNLRTDFLGGMTSCEFGPNTHGNAIQLESRPSGNLHDRFSFGSGGNTSYSGYLHDAPPQVLSVRLIPGKPHSGFESLNKALKSNRIPLKPGQTQKKIIICTSNQK